MNTIKINNTEVAPGENAIIRLNVGRLPSDTRIHLNVHVYNSLREGPTMLVLGGVHGDEINGIEIVRRAIASRFFEDLAIGAVVAIPVLNIYGFNNFSREVVDGKDVNRSFPGSNQGSLASRVANTFTKKILPIIDFGVDFHTGGNSHYNYPQIRYTRGDSQAKKLAEAFDPHVLYENKAIPRSLRKTALDKGKPILVYEGGENLRFDEFSIEKGLEGLNNLMIHQGLKKGKTVKTDTTFFNKAKWIRSPRAGIFRWIKTSGDTVKKGEILGVINDPYGQDEIPIISKKDGYIFGHNNAPVVSQGDALFHIGWII